MTKQPEQILTVRARVLAVVNRTPRPLTGIEIAKAAKVPYKSTIDALNSLLNNGKIERIGRKHTARWSWVSFKPTGASTHLNALFADRHD